MKRIPEHVVQEVIAQSDIVRVVGEYVRLEKRGSRWTGLCPFHTEKTPSFGVNEERGFFYCFGCKKGGDAITFMREMEGCGYVEAVERLAAKAGVPISYEGEDDPEERRRAQEKDALYELYERLAGAFHHLLLNDQRGAGALSYAASRHLGQETVKAFRLGYAPSDRRWLSRFLATKGYSKGFLASSGLFSQNYADVAIFSDRLMFPIKDERGRTVAFGGRLLSGDGPKYINSPETAIFRKHDTLFALSDAKEAMRSTATAILCEGYMDALAFHAAGVRHAVAPLGTSFTEGQAKLIKRFASTVVLAFDTDQAGLRATERAIGLAEAQGLAVRILSLSSGKDPAEYLEKLGPEQLKKESASTITSDDFLLNVSRDIEAASGGQAAFSYLFPFAAAMPSDIRRDAFLDAAAARLRADPASVRSDYARSLQKAPARRESQGPVSVQPAFKGGPDAEFLAALVANPGLYPQVRSAVNAQDFPDEVLKDAFITIEERYRNEDMGSGAICQAIRDDALRAYILERLASGVYETNPERYIEDGLYRLRVRALEERKKRVVARIREYDPERDGDELSMNDLLYEKMYLDSELARIKEERNGRS